MSDIVERLRSAGDKEEGRPYSTMHEAADEIERLHTDYGILKHDYDTKRAALDDCYREIKRLQEENAWLLGEIERLRAALTKTLPLAERYVGRSDGQPNAIHDALIEARRALGEKT